MATLSITDKLRNPTSDESQFVSELTNRPNEALKSDFDSLTDEYANKGWTRKYFYDVCIEAINNVEPQSKQFDLLDNFITGLTGECHPGYVIRLPNEPVDRNAFLEYVYSNEWRV